jgi:hypothetical protein
MWRGLAIAALGAALLVMPLQAQRRGGASFSVGAHAGFSARGPVAAHRGPVFGVGPHGRVHFGTGFRGSSFLPNHFDHRRSSRWHLRLYPGYAGAYYVYPGYYGYADYQPDYADDNGFNTYPSYIAPPDYSGQISQIQQDEIDRLEGEVERLREEREARESSRLSPPQPEAASKSSRRPATVLVFRDKHTQEVQNYAIVGNTLWVFTEQRASKIPLAAIDVPATQKTNDDCGTEFRLPK